jgi:hypothetical protein
MTPTFTDKCFRALTCLGWLDGSVHTVFFGHSFGAIVAFELTRRIERETRQLHQGGAGGAAASDNIVDHLIVSGIPAPHIMQVLFADINNCSHWSEEKLRYVMQAGTARVDVHALLPILILTALRLFFSSHTRRAPSGGREAGAVFHANSARRLRGL